MPNVSRCDSSQDAPVQAQVREALARPRVAHALRPSATSSQRIVGDLRSAKWSTRREERYRILSGHRAGLSAAEGRPVELVGRGNVGGGGDDDPVAAADGEELKEKAWALGKLQVVDLLCEHAEDQGKQDKVSSRVGATGPGLVSAFYSLYPISVFILNGR